MLKIKVELATSFVFSGFEGMAAISGKKAAFPVCLWAKSPPQPMD